MKPRLTKKILHGIITAVSALEAGGFEEHEKEPEAIEEMERAGEWAEQMLQWMEPNKQPEDDDPSSVPPGRP